MNLSQEIQKKIASHWFKYIQEKIYKEFQMFEIEFARKKILNQNTLKKIIGKRKKKVKVEEFTTF